MIIGFQTNRKNVVIINASRFNNRNIANLKVFLNSHYYTYGNINLDIMQNQFDILYDLNHYYTCGNMHLCIMQNQFDILYDMYANFQHAYYLKDNEPLLGRQYFIHLIPLIVIECSKQNDTLKNAPLDVRIGMKARTAFPARTAALCLIIHDRIIQYNSVTGEVRKLI